MLCVAPVSMRATAVHPSISMRGVGHGVVAAGTEDVSAKQSRPAVSFPAQVTGVWYLRVRGFVERAILGNHGAGTSQGSICMAEVLSCRCCPAGMRAEVYGLRGLRKRLSLVIGIIE